MNKKHLFYVIPVAIITVLATFTLYLLISRQSANDEAGVANESQEFSIEDVKKHSSADSCWVIIGQRVYNITPIVNNETYGFAQYCGGIYPTEQIATKDIQRFNNTIESHTLGIVAP